MHTEIEERVLEVNVEEITKRLEDLNALKVGEWNQKRYVYDFNPKRENEWIRLRDTGEQITLTYKNVEKNSIDGTKELEVEVSDFEETNQLLKILGYNPKGYQENKPTYMEIEGKTIEEVKEIEKILEIDEEKITNLNCQDIYQKIYGINIDEIKELKF